MDDTQYRQADGTYAVKGGPGYPPIIYRKTADGTFYHVATDPGLVRVLEACRHAGTRLRLTYGDPETGRLWGDADEGRLGRSMGPIRVPILLNNSRSSGGGAILDHCIVRVDHSNRRDGVIWESAAASTKPQSGGQALAPTR